MRALADRLDGCLLRPGDASYDDARSIWNAMIDRRQLMVASCASVADVAAAVRTARTLGLEIAVRCGGHNVTGLAVPDDGLMIDLTLMGAVRVDPVEGHDLGQFPDLAAQAFLERGGRLQPPRDAEAGVRRAYPPAKLALLGKLKQAYDPGSVFHLNHNIRPSESPR